jgi:hypothetical protein
MGLFRRKKRDEGVAVFEGNVVRSFSHIREDIELQKQWIGYLSRLHSTLSQAHHQHRALTQSDLDGLKRWIAHLQTNSKRQEASMAAFEKGLRDTISSYNRHLLFLYRHMRASHEREKALRKQIVDEVKALLREAKTEREAVSQTRTNDKAIPTGPDVSLSNPEQKLLNLMLTVSDPVSYQALAQRTGNSINTVRVIMNALKKRELIEEHILPSGMKLFAARNRERIKKLYNLN